MSRSSVKSKCEFGGSKSSRNRRAVLNGIRIAGVCFAAIAVFVPSSEQRWHTIKLDVYFCYDLLLDCC